MKPKFSFFLAIFLFSFGFTLGQNNNHQGHNHNHSAHDHSGHSHDGHSHSDKNHKGHDHKNNDHDHHTNACGFVHHADEFNPGAVAFHHISDQNIYSIGPWHFPLPCITYTTDGGFNFFSSGKFKADYHGNATKAYKGFVLYEGALRKVTDQNFPKDLVDIGHHNMQALGITGDDGKEKAVVHLCHGNKSIPCENKSTMDFGLFGGGFTSFYDFSITKNVFSMLLVCLLLGVFFIGIAKKYRQNPNKAPSGSQGLIETMFVFIQDEVCKPFLGHKWEKYTPFLMSIFFFILALNLFGQVPFFGGSNVTGNLAVTAVLAIIAFFVVNFSGNRDYWKHVLWMPGIPAWVKIVVTPVEIAGLFIKPVTLMLRLFGNMTAGHMVIVIFVGLIFIFGQNGANPGAAWGTTIASTLLTLFMMAIELLVAFIQAFVFTILTASYLGASTEEHHAH